MLGIHRFLTLIRDLSHMVGFDIVQNKRDVLVERRMIVFERQDIISTLLGDGAGNVLLTAHGVDRYDASLEVS